ncbi:MAG TPA: GNAT family N-acetyltransferase [Rickettsiales bacterium]|nr:GNAT family N-acetyltransferase [Rickettsiales bacterium]
MKIPSIPLNDELELTEVYPSDKGRILEIVNAPGYLYPILNGKLGADGRRMPAEESIDEFLRDEVVRNQQITPRTGYIFAVREQRGEKRFMGMVEVVDLNKDGDAELGYGVATELQGTGAALRGVVKAVDYAMTKLGVKTLRATVDPDNAPSIRMLDRFGFTQEGTPYPSTSYTDLEGGQRLRQNMRVDEATLKEKLYELKQALGYSSVRVSPADPFPQRGV